MTVQDFKLHRGCLEIINISELNEEAGIVVLLPNHMKIPTIMT